MRNPLPGLALAASALLIAGTAGTAQAAPTPDLAPHPATGQGNRGHHAERACSPSGKAKVASCFAEVMVPDGNSRVPHTSAPPAGALKPAQLQDAYKLAGASSGGRTVALVDAYGYPNLERDLGVYRSQFGLSPCTEANGCLHVVDQNGGSNLPQFNAGWAGETALDVDAVSAACPDCKITVVQADSATIANLGTAAATAAQQPGVVAVSNSYGGGDLSDASYGAYYDHPGIAVTASTGDSGYQGGSFPASSSHVTAVGGTSLTSASNARGWSESVWNGAGSGCSTVNAALPAASGFDTGCSKRAIADVSAAADPANGGLAVYYPTSQSQSTWAQVGGTSESSPIIAAVYALSGNTSGEANAIPYQHAGSLFDVTSGSNGACSTSQWCTARSGWDGPTGLGTPHGTGAF